MRLQPVLVTATAMLGLAVPALAAVQVPSCGLSCLLGGIITNSECRSFANTTCLCTNQQVTDQLSACVLETCSIRDALSMQRFSDETCDRSRVDNTYAVRVVPPLFGALAFLLFGIRIISRCATGKRGWKADDWAIVPAVLTTGALVILCIFLSKGWIGIDMWYLEPDQVTHLLYLFYVGEILYTAIIPMTKISVLLFYLQIFTDRFYRRATMGLIFLNMMYLIAFVISTAFQCTPVSGAWETWDGTFEATCRDLNKQVWVAATVNIILDVAMLVLPMPALWKLNMSLRKRLQVMIMFSLGLFVTIVSMLRLQYVVNFAKTRNATQDFVPLGLWSIVEVCVGVICACLPALRSLLATVLPKVFGATIVTVKSGDGTGVSQSQSHIRVKSEVIMHSQSRRPDEEDSSIELILHGPSMGMSMQQPRPIRPRAKRNTRELEADIEAALDAAAAAYPGDQHDSAHLFSVPPKPLP